MNDKGDDENFISFKLNLNETIGRDADDDDEILMNLTFTHFSAF